MNKKHFLSLLMLLSLSARSTLAVEPKEFCMNPALEKTAIQAEGRVLPLFVHAKKIRKFIFPEKTCEGISPVALYCMMSFGRTADVEKEYNCNLTLVRIDHEKTAKFFGLPEGTKKVDATVANARRPELGTEYQAQQAMGSGQGGYALDLANLAKRVDTLFSIQNGDDWKVAVGGDVWLSLRELDQSARAGGKEEAILNGRSYLTPSEVSGLKWETLYEKTGPFHVAVLVCLIGFLLSILAIKNPKFVNLAAGALVLLIVLEIFGIVARVMISGRGPVTNMYETVLWAGFGAFTLSAIIGFKLKDQRIWALGFAGNMICLFMMNFATTMLDGSIRPLVPVLRDNFWLSTHVTTITFSYACFALSWLIANFVLLRWIAGERRAEIVDRWNYVCRIAMQVGAVFLAAGIILGGVWADYSWGRFWGWDPKETWSLIAFMVYLGILHGRYVGWFKGINFTRMAAVGFMFVLMAWFGVNYILAVGLHSYGFSSGGATFLISVFLAQNIIILAALRGGIRNVGGKAKG